MPFTIINVEFKAVVDASTAPLIRSQLAFAESTDALVASWASF